jgi:hypothetical protein
MNAFPYVSYSSYCIRFLDVGFGGRFRRSLWSAIVSVSIQEPFGDMILHFVFEITDVAQ